MPAEAYLWFKALHIIGVVVWFSGLFYLVRLFIYHVEAGENEQNVHNAFKIQYTLMEKRLANIITTPGMILTVSMAIALLTTNPEWMSQRWLQIKLCFVGLLLIYHFYCYTIMNQLHNDTCNWTAKQLRALNELPTLLLFIVVLLAVFKNQFPTNTATWSVVGLILFMALSIQYYARYRRLQKEKMDNV